MIERLIVTSLPVLFLSLLYGNEIALRLRGRFSGGDPPIERALFGCCKYGIVIPWGATVLSGWGVSYPALETPGILRWPALGFWFLGFVLLIMGRLGLGSAFRIGLAKEETRLRVGGIFRLSRNPMYLGIDATLVAAALYTLNPIVVAVGVFIGAVHHRIILVEEARLHSVFGQAYGAYCRSVRRYL